MKYQVIDIEYFKQMKEMEQFKKEFNWLLKSIKYGYLVFILIILITYALAGKIVIAQPSDIQYNFSENVLYDDSIIESEAGLFNKKYPKFYSDNYIATYSFIDDLDGSNPLNWSVNEPVDTTVNVISDFNQHDKVIELSDDSWDYLCYVQNNFSSLENGTIQFWFSTTNIAKESHFKIIGVNDYDLIELRIDNPDLQYYQDGVGWTDALTLVNNQWYNVRIDFFIDDDSYDLYVDRNLIKSDAVVSNPSQELYCNKFKITTELGGRYYDTYIDAVGIYPFDSDYNIGDNLYTRLEILDDNSLPIEYTEIDYDSIEGDINATWSIDNESLHITPRLFAGHYLAKIDFDLFSHTIYNISEIQISYNIYANVSMVGGLLQLRIETDSTYNYTSGSSLYGINETVGSFSDDLPAYDIYILADSTSSYELYIDLLRFEYVPIVDKMEFAFNSTGSLNNIGDDDVNNWIDIENDYYNSDAVNCYFSDDALDRSIRVYAYADDWCGIERTFSFDYGIYNNISWQFDLNEYGRGGHNKMVIDIQIYSYDLTEIFYIRLEGQSNFGFGGKLDSGKAYYYDGVDYIYLQEQFPADNIDFSMFWINGLDSNATFKIDGNEYSFPSLNYIKTGIGKIRIRGSCLGDTTVSAKLDLEIDYVAIHIDGLATSDDGYSTQLFYYLGVNNWNFVSYPFIKFDFDIGFQNNISIMLSGSYEVIAYDESFGLASLWKNLYDSVNYPYPYFEIENGTGGFEILNVRIYGFRLVSSLTSIEYVPSFTYGSIDIQESYFYVENNDLKYSLETDDSNNEFIQLDVNIADLYSRNKSFSINHRKDTPSLFSEVKVIYSDSTFSYFESETSQLFVNAILPQDKIIDKFQFLITDNDNDFDGVITGYFSSITLIYYPNIDTILPMINFIAIIPILVILVVIPMFIYIRFKKSWIFLPTVVLFAIIGTGAGVIPLWLTVVIIFSVVSFYLIQRKRE